MSHRVDPAAIAEEARTVRLDAVLGPPRRSVPVGDSSTPESRTLTPLIMVRIQVPHSGRRGAFVASVSLRDASLAFFGHVPDDEMIMGHGHSRMTGVEIEGDMIASAAEARKIEFLVVVDILNWDHVDSRDQSVFAIEREERATGKRLGLDINHTEAGKKFGEVDKRAHFFIALRLRDLPLIYMLDGSLPVMMDVLAGAPCSDSLNLTRLRVGRVHGDRARCQHGDKHGRS